MSTNMLKVIGVAELPRVQQNPPAARAQEVRAASQGRDIAANGDSLPQTARQNETEDSSRVEQAVNQVNEFVQSLSRDLQFMVDDASGRTVIKVLDTETKEVIRQIPPEELLRIATYLTDSGRSSLLFKEQA
jgi:flagellar protein FlaG